MNKFILKSSLQIIDRIEQYDLTKDQLIAEILARQNHTHPVVSKQEVTDLIHQLLEHRLLKPVRSTFDLCVPLTVFSRAPHFSVSEALGFFEAIGCPKLDGQKSFTSADIQKLCAKVPVLAPACMELSLFESKGPVFKVRSHFFPFLEAIQADDPAQLITSVTMAAYINDTAKLEQYGFKNQQEPMAAYPNRKLIQSIIPFSGIPEKRDVSEGLQSLFKDTLFHEQEHQCSICQIQIPQMLIASHIKPFRDCGHLLEAADYQNGILLCRNHDYLFDQGYLSFDGDGRLLISDFIAKQDYQKYQVDPSYVLPRNLLTPMRQQFLAYHQKVYFKRKGL